MKHFFAALFFFCTIFAAAQTNKTLLETSELPELYLTLSLETKAEVQQLGAQFVLDKVRYDADNQQFSVVVWLPKRDFARFAATEIPFEFLPIEAPKVTADMASSYSEMMAWNKYPKYATYLAMMDSFQRKFPNLCHIDTILAATPGSHKILAAHICPNVHAPNSNPQFYYGSTIHGDEVTGFGLMLRLIHYLLNNYGNDDAVTELMNHLNIWICPLENPDGTYRTSNNNLGSSPTSTRANRGGYDLNRSYPHPLETVNQLQPEVAAMTRFAAAHHFVMSAEFHGGAEVANYPWDTWETSEKKHSDDVWWKMVARRYADSAQRYSNNYFRDEQNGITNGGDWYVIYNSRQDYMNYYQFCREITLEISTTKAPRSSNLPTYWNYNRAAFLALMEEATFGLHGTVIDANTQQPIEAQLFIDGHDSLNAHCFSHLPFGDFHRPLKAGAYTLTISAEGYCPQTATVTIADRQTQQLNVALLPFPCDAPAPIDTAEVVEPPIDTTTTVPIDSTITVTPTDSTTTTPPDTSITPDPTPIVPPPFPYPDDDLAVIGERDAIHSSDDFARADAHGDSGNESGGEPGDNGVGIAEHRTAAPFTLYPNPAQEVIVVKLSDIALARPQPYRVIDIYGRVLLVGTLCAAETRIEVRHFPAGIYLFQVGSGASVRFAIQ